ncbi:hypothetical protein [Streptomyces sp. GC420]|uniref:hypothetical protein n=1 Tax=Streptomyces sp. GC420 TaxID=2697568 RepID=UPI001414DF7B|nr:hypothetical protein [Streptomyces sp. GC420]NBM17500.1 hypothetical protein [Streptomyces sp. GC420]
MHLAIGDVVRDRSNMALGTVAGVASHPDGSLVALQVSGGALRLSQPYDLDLVARSSAPLTTSRRVLALISFVLGLFVACLTAVSALALGAPWLLAALAALGGHTAVMGVFRWTIRLTGQRRFHI